MRYLVRSAKYFIAFCVLYLIVVWLSLKTTRGMDVGIWDYILATFQSTKGQLLGVAVVVLAAFYPRFGFMRSTIGNCNIKEDGLRINNAMTLFGFKLKSEGNGELVYRASSPIKRAMLMFEDEIIVRNCADGVEIVGLRRSVARVAYQLKAYINNKRFED